jgi:thymidylate kinase
MSDHPMTEFERRLQLARPYFNHGIRYGDNILPPPIVQEFLGTPSAGKTTIISELDKFWRHQGFKAFHPQEGAEAVRHIDRKTHYYNICTGNYAYQILMNVVSGHQFDTVLFDRYMFDAYTWPKYWFRKGKITKDEMRIIQEFYIMGAKFIDFALLVICDPDVAVARETKNELSEAVGSHTNPETIKLLAECNLESYEELRKIFPQFMLLDTTKLDEKEMVKTAARMSLDVIETKILSRPR